MSATCCADRPVRYGVVFAPGLPLDSRPVVPVQQQVEDAVVLHLHVQRDGAHEALLVLPCVARNEDAVDRHPADVHRVVLLGRHVIRRRDGEFQVLLVAGERLPRQRARRDELIQIAVQRDESL